MGIFIKRPLCLFCFCFISAAFIGSFLIAPIKLALGAILLASALLFLVLSRINAKSKYGFIQSAIALIFAAVALFESFVFIDRREDKLNSLASENSSVTFVVTSEEYSSKYFTKYEGKILELNGVNVKESAYLVLENEADFVAGDRILLIGNVSRTQTDSKAFVTLPEDVSLEITPTIDKELIIKEDFDEFDILVICGKLRSFVRSVFLKRLDKDSAALSLGVLTGDDSMIATNVVRDFRRSGLSHILAVSGLHLTVILGAIEMLLRVLCVRKGKRCVIISVFSVFLLVLSSFSLSACRAVFMLLIAYLCYAISREPDTLTSLSVAGAIILFISPLSVGSISFWLSFLATLGIVLYAELLIDRRRKRAKTKGKRPRPLPVIIKKISGALTVTLSANVFICIIFWIFFGEASVISPISNLLIAPLAEVYLILTVTIFVLGGLPLIGTLLSYATGALCTLIVKLAALFSSLGFSVVSLKYPFAGVIICLSTVLLAVLFVVKLRRKFIIVALPVVSVLVFCACLVVYNNINNSVYVTYINEKDSDSILLTDSGRCVMIDVSDGSYSSFYNSYEQLRDAAFTEIESVVLTLYHARHISSLDRLFREAMVRSVCLPPPSSFDELDIMNDIISLAIENGLTVKLYGDGELFAVCDGFDMFKLNDGKREGSSRKIISFSVQTRKGVLTYADRSWHQSNTAFSISHFVSSSDALILGSHGPLPTKHTSPEITCPPLVVGADADVFANTKKLSDEKFAILIAKDDSGVKICEFEFFNE